jgi:hypothetical protein
MPRGSSGVSRALGHGASPLSVVTVAANSPSTSAASTLLHFSPSYVLDHEYGQTPQNQIMRQSSRSTVPATRAEARGTLDIEVSFIVLQALGEGVENSTIVAAAF